MDARCIKETVGNRLERIGATNADVDLRERIMGLRKRRKDARKDGSLSALAPVAGNGLIETQNFVLRRFGTP